MLQTALETNLSTSLSSELSWRINFLHLHQLICEPKTPEIKRLIALLTTLPKRYAVGLHNDE